MIQKMPKPQASEYTSIFKTKVNEPQIIPKMSKLQASKYTSVFETNHSERTSGSSEDIKAASQ